MKRQKRKPSQGVITRRFRSRSVDVEIRQAKNLIELKLDGKPIHVSIVDGEVHCQLANQFTAFSSIDDVVAALLAKEGRTWTLHGHLCGERCSKGEHHHDQGHDHHHGEGGMQ